MKNLATDAKNPEAYAPRVLVLIPTLDESRTLAALLDRISELGYPALVVDDGSRDESPEIARAHGASLIRHPRRLGKGAALLSGFHFARERGYQWVVTLDGDGQHDPADIPRLLGIATVGPPSLVLGVRNKHSAPWIRKRANRVADFFISYLAARPLCDTQSGFRVYPKEALSIIMDQPPHEQGFAFESAVLILLGQAGFPIIGVPVSGNYPRDARPSHFRPVGDSLSIARMLATRFRIFHRRPREGGPSPPKETNLKSTVDPSPVGDEENGIRRSRRRYGSLLLLVPILASLWIPLFNHRHPLLWGIPFFYTYLLAWIPLSGLCNGLVIYLTRKPRSRKRGSP